MLMWCETCEAQATESWAGYCGTCGSDLYFGAPLKKPAAMACFICELAPAEAESDVCDECYIDIVDNLDEVEILLNHPELCPTCCARKLPAGVPQCFDCEPPKSMTDWWGAEDDWDYTYRPAVIPAVADELETIPAIRSADA